MADGPFKDLVEGWRDLAGTLRSYGATEQADAVSRCAADLERTMTEDSVGLTEGAKLSGYSADHLGRLIRQGALENVGTSGRPRIRLSDLPRKAPTRKAQPSARVAEIAAHAIGRKVS